MSVQKILSPFRTKRLGKKLFHFDTIDSTQTFIKNKLLENEIDDGTIALTDHQSAGRGTQGRTWFSLPKPQLMFSILFKAPLSPQKLPLLNIYSAVVLCDVLAEFGIESLIKWPNDIYIDAKKTAGILSELVVHEKQAYVIQGIGINTDGNIDDFPEELRDKVTALSVHSSKKIDRLLILENFLVHLEKHLYDSSPADLISYTQRQFQHRWMYRNREIEVSVGDKILRGVAKDIDVTGSLLLETRKGSQKIISGSILPVPTIDKPAKNA